ncbi:MAG: type secretion system family protein [Rhodospirillales bacterium]|nr:type secretion system family protein [Rhodospirillales bacterium]
MTAAANLTAFGDDEETLALLGARLPRWQIELARLLFSGHERLDFYDILATYLDRSVRQPQALAEIRGIEIEGRAPFLQWICPLATAIPYWLFQILDRGENFGVVMAEWLPRDEAMIFAAMADAGLNSEGMRDLATFSARQASWKKSLQRALFPLFGASAMFVAGFWYLSRSLFPTLFASLPQGVALEGAAANLKATSDFFAAFGPFLLGAITLLPLGISRLLPLWTGAARKLADELPLFRLYKTWTGLGFLISLSALLKAGVSLREALEMLERRSPPYTAERLRAAILRDDAYLGEALAQSGYAWPDPRTIKLIRHFIISDRPGDALAQLAETSTQRLDASLKSLSTAITYGVQIAVFAVIFWFLQATNQMSDLVQSTTTS